VHLNIQENKTKMNNTENKITTKNLILMLQHPIVIEQA